MFKFSLKLVLIPLAISLAFCQDSKAIRVESTNVFNLEVMGAKEPVGVGDPISFQVKSNRNFYLYVFGVDKREGTAVMLLPNRHQRYHRYKKNRTYNVPGEKVEFTSDRPGREHIVLVASEEKIDIRFNNSRELGDFTAGSYEDMDTQVRAISVNKKHEKPVVRSLDIRVIDKTARPNKPMTFVSTNKVAYYRGESVDIRFGADDDGIVYLFSADGYGKPRFLDAYPVKAARVHRTRAVVDDRGGDQALIAIYSPTPVSVRDASASIPAFNDTSARGLRMEDDPGDMAYAVYRYSVE